MKQRSEEWFEARRGKFTASPISRLLTSGSRKMTDEELKEYKKENPKGRKTTIECIGDMLDTYAFEKAIEVVYGVDRSEQYVSPDMDRGNEFEPLAFSKFKQIKDAEFVEVSECSFFPYGKNAGASPDGLVGKDAILEIKCPRNPKFFNLVANGFSAIDPGYYDQMQMQMLCTNSKKGYFFNYIIYNGQEMWHTIEVPRDKERIKLIKERIEIATDRRDKYVEILLKNQQFNGTDSKPSEVGRAVLQM